MGTQDTHTHKHTFFLLLQQGKKKKDPEVKKDESAIPKKTKQAQEDSVASVKQIDPPQVIMGECFLARHLVVLLEGDVPSILVSKLL